MTMNYCTVNGKTRVWIEGSEDTQAALRAVARASYELAHPVGMGILHFIPGGTLTDKECDAFIQDDGLYMDWVKGRQCKTRLLLDDSGDFILNNRLFERDRGSPDAVFSLAIKKLNRGSSSGGEAGYQRGAR